MGSTPWPQPRHRLVDLVGTAVFKEGANVTVWLVVHVMFIEHEHRFLEHEHRFIKPHVVLSPVRTLKDSCPDLGHVTHTAEFSLMHSHTLLPSLCLILYVSNTKYLMVFQSISVLLYLDKSILERKTCDTTLTWQAFRCWTLKWWMFRCQWAMKHWEFWWSLYYIDRIVSLMEMIMFNF